MYHSITHSGSSLLLPPLFHHSCSDCRSPTVKRRGHRSSPFSSLPPWPLSLALLFHHSRSFHHGQRPPAPLAIHATVVDIFFATHHSVHVSTMGLSANIFPSSRIEYLRELSSVGQALIPIPKPTGYTGADPYKIGTLGAIRLVSLPKL